MLKSNFKLKVFAAIIIAFLCVNISEAKTASKIKNISEYFVKVNPSLKAKTAANYANIIISACEKHKQDPYVIAAIIVNESTVNHKAIGGGNYGLMQINWKAHSAALKKEYKIKKAKQLFDARINILYGTKVFAYCMSKANNVLRGALMRYSGGNEKHATKVLATLKEIQAKDKNTTKKKK
ncbi:MAG: transglycosylase SLT domain-containing protein [Synergistaceae bacterium]|nr:transglycosylase SLT domain-containing protein [Synergistaceae bacterium]